MTGAETAMVYVPCDVVDVHVRLGYGETLSAMEQMVLRAVHAGTNTVGKLNGVLGLGPRLVLDLVKDLWHCRYLLVVPATGELRVTPDVARCIAQGRMENLHGAEAFEDRIPIMVDKLSGYVLPRSGSPKPEISKLAVPVENSGVTMERTDYADRLTALERAVAARDRARSGEGGPDAQAPGRSRKVLAARLSGGDALSVAQRRWLPLDVRPSLDPFSDRLVLTVIGDTLPESHRAIASARLTKLAESHPQHALFAHIRALARPAPAEPPSPRAAIARLEERVAAAPRIPAGRRGQWHLELCGLARQLDGLIDERIEREVVATAVHGPEVGRQLLVLVRSARHQLVLCLPNPRESQIWGLLPELREAIGRSVQIVLLWGANHDSQLSPVVRNQLYDLQLRGNRARGANLMLLPSVPVRTRAGLAVCDGRAALLSGSDSFGDTASSANSIALLLTAPDELDCRINLDLITWAGECTSFDIERLLLRTPHDFELRRTLLENRAEAATQDPVGSGTTNELPSKPPDTEDAEESSVHAWHNAWEGHVRLARSRLDGRSLPAASLVIDGEHQDLLWTALREARQRLAIVTDGLAPEILDERFRDGLRSCLDRGVHVLVRYRSGGPGADDASAPLRELQEQYPALMRIEQSGHVNRLLLWDDEVALGSLGALSGEGLRARQAAHQRRRALSVRLSGAAVAQSFAAPLGLGPTQQREQPPRVSAAEQAAYVSAQLVVNAAAAHTDWLALLRAELERAEDPWLLLDRLAENAADTVLRVAAATCLDRYGVRAAESLRDRWRRWLVVDLWSAGEFIQAAILRTRIDADFRPDRPTTVLAAALGTDQGSPALDGALALLDGDETQRVAFALAAMYQSLVYGDSQSRECLELAADMMRDEVPPEWLEMVTAAVAYLEEAHGLPLPFAEIRTHLNGMEQRMTRNAAWSDLADALQHAASTTFNHSVSTRTHLRMFYRPDAYFHPLVEASAVCDAAAVADWLARLPSGGVEQVLRTESAQVSAGTEPMLGLHLKKYLRLLDRAVKCSRDVVALEESGTSQRDAPAELGPARRFADRLAESWQWLQGAAKSLAGPEAALVTSVLSALAEVAAWGGRGDAEGIDV